MNQADALLGIDRLIRELDRQLAGLRDLIAEGQRIRAELVKNRDRAAAGNDP